MKTALKIVGVLALWGFSVLCVVAALKVTGDYLEFRSFTGQGVAVVIGTTTTAPVRARLAFVPRRGAAPVELTAVSEQASLGAKRGEKVRILYDPQRLDRAILADVWDPMPKGMVYFLWILTGIVAVLALWATIAALRRRQPAEGRSPKK
ncbi:MAG: hypothetical protein KKI08_03665 [Armatimonadetes bacterium]|nr:hypothetical protein [Armatimonadota bacterium]